jgi:hypothetical protein
MGNISGPRPITILVASRDPNFERVVSFLLHRHGFDVETAHHEAPLYDSVDRYEPSVLIVDAQNVPAATLGLGLVLVDDEPTRWHGRRVLPKWGPFENLLAEVDRQLAPTRPARATVVAGATSDEPWPVGHTAAAVADSGRFAR